MTGLALQAAPTGGDLLLTLLVFLGVVVSVLLSVVVLAKGVQGYRRSGDPALVGLAVGILLLSGLPLLVNAGLASLTGADSTTVQLATDGTRLLGLGLILTIIYQTQR